jgi:hypothetical protein
VLTPPVPTAVPPVLMPPVVLAVPPVLVPPVGGAPPVALALPPVPLGFGVGSELHASASSKQEVETQPTWNRTATRMLSA